MVAWLDIGGRRIYLTTYNPMDALSRLYCVWAAHRAVELLSSATTQDIHQWLRAHIPACGDTLDAVEAGEQPRREVPIGQFPVTPGEEKFELPIVSRLNAQWGGGA